MNEIRLTFAVALASAGALLALAVGPALATVTIPVDPGNGENPQRGAIVELANAELAKNVRETRSNNVPRYRFGKGKIAPYSIGDAWCAAFATWTWGRTGFTAFMGSKLLRTTYSGETVAVQVAALSTWARRTGFWTYRAKPGDLVAYGERHIGIVTRVDRDGRAVKSIEGNQSDSVSKVDVPMSEVTGYISPTRVPASRRISPYSALADVDREPLDLPASE